MAPPARDEWRRGSQAVVAGRPSHASARRSSGPQEMCLLPPGLRNKGPDRDPRRVDSRAQQGAADLKSGKLAGKVVTSNAAKDASAVRQDSPPQCEMTWTTSHSDALS